jgi:Mitochondrial carrier protein
MQEKSDIGSEHSKVVYTGTWDCLIQLYGRDGVSALFTGIRAKLLQTVLTAAFTFLSYEAIVKAVHNYLYQSTALQKPTLRSKNGMNTSA